MLTEQDAIEIYKYKMAISCAKAKNDVVDSLRGKSVSVSKMYEISPRTVRDIWNRQTWTNATSHLWKDESISSNLRELCRVMKVIRISDRQSRVPLVHFPNPDRVPFQLDKGIHKKEKIEHHKFKKSRSDAAKPISADFVLITANQYERASMESTCCSSKLPQDPILATRWVESLSFSVQDDPFHDDWPHW